MALEGSGFAIETMDTAGAEARICRELILLECARQAVEDEISRLRQLQARKVS